MSNIPIWVTDPAGNDNPYLAITPKSSFVVGSKGQQLGPGDYYTSADGITWASHIGGLSVSGASFNDGNASLMAANNKNFLIGYDGTGTFGGASWLTQIKRSSDGKNFSLSSNSGYGNGSSAPTHGLLFLYYDAQPVSGNAGFRLATQNMGITQVTYFSSYDGGSTWATDQTLSSPQSDGRPAAWGPAPIQSYAKGKYNGSTFYVAAIPHASSNIYGGTGKPTPPILDIPAGWSLLFSPSQGGGAPHIASLVSVSSSNTTFVVGASSGTSAIVASGTGDPATWREIALGGSLAITHAISGDTSTFVYS